MKRMKAGLVKSESQRQRSGWNGMARMVERWGWSKQHVLARGMLCIMYHGKVLSTA